MNTRRFVHILRWLQAATCVLSWFVGTSAHAAAVRVLVVTGRGVSDDDQAAIESAVNADAELIDPREYQRLARAAGQLPTSEAALERVAPRVQAQLIIVAHKAGAKLVVIYRDGATGEVLHKDSLPARHRGAAAARFHTRLTASVHKMLGTLAVHAGAGSAAPPRPAAAELEPEPPPQAAESEAAADDEPNPSTNAFESEPSEPSEPDPGAAHSSPGFVFELSAGLGGAMRQSALPTRLGLHQFDSGVFAGVALGMRVQAPLGGQGLVRASVDYRSSLGLQGTETQRQTEMSTSLRSHAVGFGVAPGFRFGSTDSISLLLHLGWYFRGLRPIAQLALPEVSWHAAVIRPELIVPLADGAVTLRLAPELLVIAGLYTTLPDESGLARTGLGFGGEASLDVRLAAAVGLRFELRESHAVFSTAWARSISDVERFAAVRVLLWY